MFWAQNISIPTTHILLKLYWAKLFDYSSCNDAVKDDNKVASCAKHLCKVFLKVAKKRKTADDERKLTQMQLYQYWVFQHQ